MQRCSWNGLKNAMLNCCCDERWLRLVKWCLWLRVRWNCESFLTRCVIFFLRAIKLFRAKMKHFTFCEFVVVVVYLVVIVPLFHLFILPHLCWIVCWFVCLWSTCFCTDIMVHLVTLLVISGICSQENLW